MPGGLRVRGPISIPDLHDDDRFPRFAKSALDEGLVAVFTFPLRNDDHGLGALDLYRTTPGALNSTDMVTAQTLADVATAYLLNAEYRTAKDELIATVSHELRTPITSIVGFVELLLGGDAGALSADQQRFLTAIGHSSRRLAGLADNLLTVSSLDDSGRRNPHVALDLGEVIQAAEHVLEPLIAARRLSVTFEIPSEPVTVKGNLADLEAMVVNLMSNGMKFTEDGGWVNCELRTIDGVARIEVSDNGLGIPHQEQRDLFTQFFRSSTAQAHAIQGTGLGLTIVDSIVHSHGGDISVDSEHLEGSTFTVDLPLQPGPPGTTVEA